jgi:hypothetical protein
VMMSRLWNLSMTSLMFTFINSDKLLTMIRFPIYVIPFSISILCFLGFSFANSYVDTEGFLQEPFFLIPLGFSFLLIGLIMLVINLIRRP